MLGSSRMSLFRRGTDANLKASPTTPLPQFERSVSPTVGQDLISGNRLERAGRKSLQAGPEGLKHQNQTQKAATGPAKGSAPPVCKVAANPPSNSGAPAICKGVLSPWVCRHPLPACLARLPRGKGDGDGLGRHFCRETGHVACLSGKHRRRSKNTRMRVPEETRPVAMTPSSEALLCWPAIRSIVGVDSHTHTPKLSDGAKALWGL